MEEKWQEMRREWHAKPSSQLYGFVPQPLSQNGISLRYPRSPTVFFLRWWPPELSVTLSPGQTATFRLTKVLRLSAHYFFFFFTYGENALFLAKALPWELLFYTLESTLTLLGLGQGSWQKDLSVNSALRSGGCFFFFEWKDSKPTICSTLGMLVMSTNHV